MTAPPLMSALMLAEPHWQARAAAHRERAQSLVGERQRRAAAGIAHPVWDFLFDYYSLRPSQLRRWHPGFGVTLAGAHAQRQYLGRTGYVHTATGVTVDRYYLAKRRTTVAFVARLLGGIGQRPARLNCFGLHEWAMVYRTPARRHGGVPLRLGAAGTDAVVNSMPLRCTHFDAFRFFTEAAEPRNSTQLTRADQLTNEQPGCVHVSMDLYKWAYKLGPLINSELVLDALELAVSARELDMRASPYDLTDFGFSPIRIEEPAGRAEYAQLQSELMARAAPIRISLFDRCNQLLAAPT